MFSPSSNAPSIPRGAGGGGAIPSHHPPFRRDTVETPLDSLATGSRAASTLAMQDAMIDADGDADSPTPHPFERVEEEAEERRAGSRPGSQPRAQDEASLNGWLWFRL